MADNDKPTPATASSAEKKFPQLYNMDIAGPKKFEVNRWTASQVERYADPHPSVFRVYSVIGVTSDKWELASAKVDALILKRDFTVVLRRADTDKTLLVAEARLTIREGVMERLDAVGKTVYHHIETDARGKWGIVYIPLSEPSESKELDYIAANPLRLGSWALKRLRPRIIEWAEERL